MGKSPMEKSEKLAQRAQIGVWPTNSQSKLSRGDRWTARESGGLPKGESDNPTRDSGPQLAPPSTANRCIAFRRVLQPGEPGSNSRPNESVSAVLGRPL